MSSPLSVQRRGRSVTTPARIFAADSVLMQRRGLRLLNRRLQRASPSGDAREGLTGLPGSGRSDRLQLVDQQGFDHDRALGYEPRRKTRLRNQRTEKIEVGIRRQQDIDVAILCEPLA
jgi:hypothetical protein